MISSQEAADTIVNSTRIACQKINDFSHKVLRTRGGRIGSGMGILLEALWGYYVNQILQGEGGSTAQCEIGWLSEHEYNDFACVQRDQQWVPETRMGELLRIEAKSMNADADESKAHFDELIANLGQWDLLLVLIWSWEPVDQVRVYPCIRDYFIGPARPIAQLRDCLHIARGGSFVDRSACPDRCEPEVCVHQGEPLNASGKRERLSGPETRRPSRNVSYAANFGGLVRMLKTSSGEARRELRRIRAEDDVAHDYISFIHRNFPDEERNQYLASEWQTVASRLNIVMGGLSKDALVELVRARSNYRDLLRALGI
jgi:hypothetical protein